MSEVVAPMSLGAGAAALLVACVMVVRQILSARRLARARAKAEPRHTEHVRRIIPLGAVVRLRSGGPIMTASHYGFDTHFVYCIWFVDGVREVDSFGHDALEIVTRDAEPTTYRT